MLTAPLAKQVVTIMGSISGVKPTAIEIAYKKASSHTEASPPASILEPPFTMNTKGTITSMKRMSSQDTAFTPLVKLVSTASPATALAMDPKSELSPTEITTPIPLPDTTLEPMNAILSQSVTESAKFSSRTIETFSKGSDSPVSEDWLT